MKRFLIAFLVLAMLAVVNVFAFDVADHPWTKSIVLIGNLQYRGMGTGFIVTEDGYVVTAGHVVESVGTVVVFPEPLLYRKGRLVYSDPIHDVALIKVEIANFEIVPLPIGKLKDSKIGDPVLVLGHPYGIGWLFARGILSGVKYDSGGYAYLFSDVASAPGSSGSPMLNFRGEVIGLLQAGYEGVGCIGIGADRLVTVLTAVIAADRELEKTRYELDRLQERARREWKRLTEPKE